MEQKYCATVVRYEKQHHLTFKARHLSHLMACQGGTNACKIELSYYYIETQYVCFITYNDIV